MGKFIIEIILIGVAGFIAQQFFPWWSIAIVAGIVGLLFRFNSSVTSFFAGFLAVLFLWGGYAYYLDHANLQLLSTKVGGLLGDISPNYLIWMTAILGGLIGGLSAMTGNLGRKLIS